MGVLELISELLINKIYVHRGGGEALRLLALGHRLSVTSHSRRLGSPMSLARVRMMLLVHKGHP